MSVYTYLCQWRLYGFLLALPSLKEDDILQEEAIKAKHEIEHLSEVKFCNACETDMNLSLLLPVSFV